MLFVKIRKQLGRHSAEAPRADDAGATRRTNAPAREGEGFMLDVEFEAPPGVTVLFGASGSGKSVTLKTIAGILRPDEGRIAVGHHLLFDSEKRIDLPIRERRAGYVFQNLALFPHLTALGNVEFALAHLSRRERREHAREMLEQFRIGHTADRRPRDISGGEAQRVALARALASRPRLLLLDEPLSALDEQTKLDIISDLKSINRRLSLPVIYVTHSREEAVALGERAVLYEAGRILARGEPLQLFGPPRSASVARLTGVENLFRASVVSRNAEAGTLTLELLSQKGTGSCRVDAPLGDYARGSLLTLAIRSGDILLATEEPRSTSARNILRGQISSIEETGGQVRVRVTSGVEWVVAVTRQAARELSLQVGKEVWLAFKTYSCHLLDD